MTSQAIRRVVLTFLVITLLRQSGGAQDQWLMKAHDTRRTGQSRINGPREITQTWVAEQPAAHVVNIGATVTENGVFFGSWGLLRNDSLGRDVRFWDKSDGKLYGLNPNTGESLWGGPLDLDITHRCYEFDGRERTGTDVFFCGLSPYIASFYNGTVEGQPAVDTERNVLYVGRGDGKLYAIDPQAGRIKWRYLTFNPQLPEDPDGGGEIISSPVVGPGGTIYCGTWGVGPYETNAFYAINPDSSLQWRFPSDSSLTGRPIFVSPAISPDQSTIYFGTFFAGDVDHPGKLFALNLQPESSAPDEQRLKWDLELINDSKPVWTTTLAVGSDGTLYVGGLFVEGVVNRPVVFAVEDNGIPQLKWSTPFVSFNDGAQWVGGIALREIEGETVRLYVATTVFRNNNNREEGSLYALDPASGEILAQYDPSDDVPTAVGGLNSPAIGADGTIYFGVRGKFEQALVEPVNGQVFAIEFNESSSIFQKLWNFEVDGHIEWNHPAIGPDGGIYIGSSVGGSDINTYDLGVVPSNSTCKFYALKGPANPVTVPAASSVPETFRLDQNYPNPFNPQTTIEFHLTQSGHVRLTVYNVLGESVATLVDGWQPKGSHRFVWNGTTLSQNRALSSGVFVYELKQHALTLRRKMLLLR